MIPKVGTAKLKERGGGASCRNSQRPRERGGRGDPAVLLACWVCMYPAFVRFHPWICLPSFCFSSSYPYLLAVERLLAIYRAWFALDAAAVGRPFPLVASRNLNFLPSHIQSGRRFFIRNPSLLLG